jgi:hypothetical protein
MGDAVSGLGEKQEIARQKPLEIPVDADFVANERLLIRISWHFDSMSSQYRLYQA